MEKFKVIEKFLSIDGEGPTAGEIATFIRLGGCNLKCGWCDTEYSISPKTEGEFLSKEDIYAYIKENDSINVTITGGEPLIQKDIEQLICFLAEDKRLFIHIETNGSIPVSKFKKLKNLENVSFILDYKLQSSKMESKMDLSNYENIRSQDVVKFVIGSEEDLKLATKVINTYKLSSKCLVYFSPVTNMIEPKVIVEYMKENKMNKVRLQVQLHKIIWPSETRGV